MRIDEGIRVAALAVLSGAVLSCAVDSRWFEQKRLQEAAVEHATPKKVRVEGGKEKKVNARPMKARVYATERYAAEVLDWKGQVEDLVGEANDVLGEALGIRIQVAEAQLWPTGGKEDELTDLLTDLKVRDPGGATDWVIGFAGSVPRAEISFHELGLSTRPGKHFVVRAINDAVEFAAFEKGLTRIGESERRALYQARKRHKRLVIFLHELGHTLGLIHRASPTDVMNPRYSSASEVMGADATEWMNAALNDRVGGGDGQAALGEVLRGLLSRNPDGWVHEEREAMMESLGNGGKGSACCQVSGSAGSTQPGNNGVGGVSSTSPGSTANAGGGASGGVSNAGAGSAKAAPAPAPVSTLPDKDRGILAKAEALEAAGKDFDAWTEAKPLYKKYPNDFVLQDFRCRVAMRLEISEAALKLECADLMRLSGVGKK